MVGLLRYREKADQEEQLERVEKEQEEETELVRKRITCKDLEQLEQEQL